MNVPNSRALIARNRRISQRTERLITKSEGAETVCTAEAAAPSYRIERQYEGVWHVLDEDDERAARVGCFMPGPMVSYSGPSITSPAMARAVAAAMVALADEIDSPSSALA